jgi:hypothetical protein
MSDGGLPGALCDPDIRRANLALFKVDQRVLVIDHASPHHAMFGKVIVVTLGQDRFLYWLRLDTNPKGGLFGEEQLQAA